MAGFCAVSAVTQCVTKVVTQCAVGCRLEAHPEEPAPDVGEAGGGLGDGGGLRVRLPPPGRHPRSPVRTGRRARHLQVSCYSIVIRLFLYI